MSIQSSYAENNYGAVFYNTIKSYAPGIGVELGVLHGYSTLYIAKALRDNGFGHLHSYDLWDQYSYNHGDMQQVGTMLKQRNVGNFVTLYNMDAFEVHKLYEKNSIDFLHIDISNNGDILEKMFDNWDPILRCMGLFFFEGGSEERDKIEWMVKYNKKPIRPVVLNHPELNRRYHYGVYRKYPSLSVFIKKLDADEGGVIVHA